MIDREAEALQAFLQIVPSTTRENARRLLLQADHDVNRAVNFFLNLAAEGGEEAPAESKPEEEQPPAACWVVADGGDGGGGEPGAVADTGRSTGEEELVHHSVVESSFFQSQPSQFWKHTVDNCRKVGEKFTDPDFIPGPSSIDGREVNEKLGSSVIQCNCRVAASLKVGIGTAIPSFNICFFFVGFLSALTDSTHFFISYLKRVRKDGPNQGKLFYTCGLRKCKFFQWTSKAPHTAQALDLTWKRFDGPEYVPCRGGEAFESSDVLQGAVGDCWFLSGLAVIAEQKHLIKRIFPVVQKNYEGVYEGKDKDFHSRTKLRRFYRSIYL